LPVRAQDTVQLTLDEVLYNVARYHPVGKQAALLQLMADGNLMVARGGFDPLLGLAFDEKKLDGKHYYSQFGTGLKVPTRLGAEVKAGFDRAAGTSVNDADETAEDGLLYAGVSVPLGRRLLTDERRTALAQARLMEQQADADRRAVMNALLGRVMNDYAQWSTAFATYTIYREAASLADARLRIIRRGFEIGERSAPDTLEAYLQYQSRVVERNVAELNMIKAYFAVEAHLWDADGNALAPALKNPVVPELPSALTLHNQRALPLLEDDFAAAQPELVSYDFTLRQLDAERRLKTEMLKPQVDVQYNLLQQPFYNGASLLSGISANNYKLGVNFYMPLFLRKERGSLQLTRLKLEAKRLELQEKRRQLWTKFLAGRQQEAVLVRQLNEVTAMAANYQRLLDVENLKFGLGESSLFMVNAREVKVIEARTKVAETELKLFAIRVEIRQIAGTLAP
jgi:outer membrane protein TolC